VWFESGAQQLHLGVEEPFAPARKAHPALRVRDVETLESLAKRLGDVRWDSDLPGFRRFYTDDPFGNRLELLAPFPAPGSGAGTTPLTVQSAHSGHRSAGAPLGGGEG
jgi:hypothetical protein